MRAASCALSAYAGHLEHDGVREKHSGLRRHDTEGLTPPDEGVEVRGR